MTCRPLNNPKAKGYLGCSLKETRPFQQCLHLWFATPEPDVEFHGIFRSTPGEDVLTEPVCDFRIEDPLLLEVGKGICIQDFRPFIAVVPGRIPTLEDMGK